MYGFMNFNLNLLIGIILVALTNGLPVKSRFSLRQIELTTPAATFLAKTPYPAAGYRPRIAFELPNESRQPKAMPEPTTTTTTTTTPISSSVEEEEDELDNSVQIPADTYGAPRPHVSIDSTDSTELVDNNVEIVITPTTQFEPPTKDAVEDFGATTINNQQPSKETTPSNSNELELESETQNSTESEEITEDLHRFYGPPVFAADGRQVPAFTYGAPEVNGIPENELLSIGNQNRFADLRSGRLIFVPADGSQLRQIYFAAIPSRSKPKLSKTARLIQRRM